MQEQVDDMRNSPSAAIMWGHSGVPARPEGGTGLSYPCVPRFPKMWRNHFNLAGLERLTPEVPAGFDCVLMITNHDDGDCNTILQHAPLIVDTCGRHDAMLPNVVKA